MLWYFDYASLGKRCSLVKEGLKKGAKLHEAYEVIVEIACTRSAEEPLGAWRAYHSLFEHSMEEDIDSRIPGVECKLLVPLVCAYTYEGSKVKGDAAKSEAKTLARAMKHAAKKAFVEDTEVIRIITTRSNPHLLAVYKHHKELSGRNLDEDVDDIRVKEAVQCLCVPRIYFSQVLNAPLRI